MSFTEPVQGNEHFAFATVDVSGRAELGRLERAAPARITRGNVAQSILISGQMLEMAKKPECLFDRGFAKRRACA
jgi:hypothetical protein